MLSICFTVANSPPQPVHFVIGSEVLSSFISRFPPITSKCSACVGQTNAQAPHPMHSSACASNGAAIIRLPPRLTYPIACCPITSAHTRTQSPQTMQRSDLPAAPETRKRGVAVIPYCPAKSLSTSTSGQRAREELEDHPAQLPHPLVSGFNDISCGGDVDAGGDHPGPFALFDFHDAEPARAVVRHSRVMAQRGDVDAEAPGHAQRRLVGIGFDLLPVDRENSVLLLFHRDCHLSKRTLLNRLLNNLYSAKPARVEADAAFDAARLVDRVRLFLLAGDHALGALPYACRAARAGVR